MIVYKGGNIVRNINELVGIVKGIRFDGVINEKEVDCLQLWVDKNRNLVYESKQVELIRLVDSVLEDRKIEEYERLQILEKAEDYLNNSLDETSKIYELNGIVEGIVSDGIVNAAEVFRLKKWMDLYGEYIKTNKSSNSINKAVENILEDGVVTEDEQTELLELLNAKIKNSQFETKLEYLCEQVKNRKNIGVDLIDLLDNEIAICEIHSRAEKQLMMALSSNGRLIVNQEIIVISLVLIAMLQYDGNYYGNVRNTYLKVYEKYSEQKVEGLIRTLLSKYRKQDEIGNSGNRVRIINVVLENAIVPKVFLTAFFEFIFDIYKLNFEYDLPENMYDDFRFVYDGLRNNLLSDGDDLSLNVTQKTYKLIAATKQLIKREEGLDAIIKLSILIVKLIDKRYWNKEIKIYNPYLKEGFNGWEKQLKGAVRGRREKDAYATELRSRWEPKFVMRNNDICLVTPIHKVKAQYDYKKITVVVYNSEKEIYRNTECDIREIIGGYQINTNRIHIEKPLGEIRYKLLVGNEVIYDSRDKLFRDYIVFDADGNEISNNTDFEGTAFFCYYKQDVEGIKNIALKTYYCIGYKLVRNGDAIEIGHDVFNFSAMVKPGIFGQIYPKCYVKSIEDEVLYPVYKEASVVAFEADNISNKFEIIINGKAQKLNEKHYKTTEKGATTKYIVELGLDKSGIYSIEINQFVAGRKNRILKEVFAYDAKLNISTEKLDEYSYRLKVVSGLLEHTIDAEVTADEFDKDFIRFKDSGDEYIFCFTYGFGFYSCDNVHWNPMVEDLWIDDVKMDTVLTICDANCDGLSVYNEKGVLVEEDIRLHDHGYYSSIPIYFLNSYKNENKHVLLVFTSGGKAKHILYCYNKCVIEAEKTEIVCVDNPKIVMIMPVYRGKNKVFFEVFNHQGEKVYMSKLLSSGQVDTLEDFQSFENYRICFHEKTKILQLRKNTLLYEINQTFYAKQDFAGRTFKIDEVYFNQLVRRELVEKVWHLNKAYVRFTDVVDMDEGVFEGEVFVKTMRGEWSLDNINPVEIEICSEVIDDTMDIYITNQGDGLLLDTDKHGILNSLEHPTAPDIFLYTISTKGEI